MIEITDANRDFKYKVIETLGGKGITKCFSCGTCTAGCPVQEIDKAYNPRRIIHLALLGMKDMVLKSDFVWMCAGCYTCTERCPQDVRLTDVMNVLKNLAVEDGIIHPSFTAQLEALKKNGALYELGEFENKKRNKFGLPEIVQNPEAVQEILKNSSIPE